MCLALNDAALQPLTIATAHRTGTMPALIHLRQVAGAVAVVGAGGQTAAHSVAEAAIMEDSPVEVVIVVKNVYQAY